MREVFVKAHAEGVKKGVEVEEEVKKSGKGEGNMKGRPRW